jgi:phosphohistidine swiveling domain-containing protein
MKFLITHTENLDEGIGGKASNLMRLGKMGIPVPAWTVIPESVILDQLNEVDQYDKVVVPEQLIVELKLFFGDGFENKTFAVRSSATDEDGAQHSFAGQFETYLHVKPEDLESSIRKIWESAVSERVLKYREENGLEQNPGIAVIIQEMIEPEVAGVAFGLDPVSGDRSTKVISSLYGLGEALVSGELDADTFKLTGEQIDERIVPKHQKFVKNAEKTGITRVVVPDDLATMPSLKRKQVFELASLLEKLEKELGAPQDVEFAYRDGQLFLLQTRPITAAGMLEEGEYTLWDNSNIIESYPGITTPLTFSFIIKMYEMVYRQFVGLMGVKEREISRHQEVFANTLGLIRGRVYYNLLNWYKMLAMLPGYSINAEYMETMMGVKERFELKEDFQMSKGMARLRIFGMVFRMIWVQVRLKGERRRFMKHLNAVMTEYKAMDFSSMSSQELSSQYARFEQTLLLKWKAPLINDFFAMIWFGMLKKKASQLCPDEPNIHNDLLCGSQDIISVEPIHRSIAIAKAVSENEQARSFFIEHTPNEIWSGMESGKFADIKGLIDSYIDKFGNRCVGELKLETISYGQDPSLFVNVIKSYVAQGVTSFKTDSNIEDELRKKAEEKIANALKGKLLKRWWFKYVLNKARDLVSNRENLRYERTRGFGMVRTMFIALGERLHQDGKISDPRDVFYLELDELLSLRDSGFQPTFKQNIEDRKKEFADYREQPDPEERFYTYGNTFTDEYIYSKEKLEPIEGDLEGIGCCPGRVQAKIRVVRDPKELDSLNGDILVTSSTDPGWVTLFPTASAIIVERGSLLSHSAIVSREMGIPCIVGVTGLLRTVKSGDEVIMDGSAGTIQIIDNG